MAARRVAALAALGVWLALPQHLDAVGGTPVGSGARSVARGGQLFPQSLDARRVLEWHRAACQCGISGTEAVDTRIVGGVEAAPHIFPWMVAILFDGYMNCGGALINDRYVLTAGHCLIGLHPQNISVMMGMNDLLSINRILPPVDQLIIHEDFTRDYLHDINDIGLIRLAKPVSFNEKVSPICLPQEDRDYTGQLGIVAGWGRVGQDKPLSRFLLAAGVRAISNELCRTTPIAEHISDTMLCTYYEKKDACQGDSGGPLVYLSDDGHFEQIGIVSWGIGCAKPNMPGVFTRITKFLKWVRHNTRDAYYCSRN